MVEILNCCRYDENNPFAREWAIYALRCLVDQHPENQHLLEGVPCKPSAIDEPDLSNLGLHARMDARGKIYVSSESFKAQKDA